MLASFDETRTTKGERDTLVYGYNEPRPREECDGSSSSNYQRNASHVLCGVGTLLEATNASLEHALFDTIQETNLVVVLVNSVWTEPKRI